LSNSALSLILLNLHDDNDDAKIVFDRLFAGGVKAQIKGGRCTQAPRGYEISLIC